MRSRCKSSLVRKYKRKANMTTALQQVDVLFFILVLHGRLPGFCRLRLGRSLERSRVRYFSRVASHSVVAEKMKATAFATARTKPFSQYRGEFVFRPEGYSNNAMSHRQ
eukprot:IDg8981t1